MTKKTNDNSFKCPKCGGNYTIRHGFNVTKKGSFPRRKCQQCGVTFYEKHDDMLVELRGERQ